MSALARRGRVAVLAALLLAAVACSSSSGGTDGAPAEPGSGAVADQPAVPGTDLGVGPPGSAGTGVVPIVEPASVEAFCALSVQLEQLTDQQMGDVSASDPEALRRAFAAFLTDNDAVIDQYVAAAPPEIEADVQAVIDQGRAAVDDPALFDAALRDTAPSNRVSAFIDANCT